MSTPRARPRAGFCVRSLLVLLGLLGTTSARAAESPSVFLVVIDGLDARWLPEMEHVGSERASGGCPVTYPQARAVIPARTNPNHVSLLTAVYPRVHGITGNSYWDRESDRAVTPLDAPELIEVETLFTIIETEKPSMRTVAVFGKGKLARLFGPAPGRQRSPDLLWRAERTARARRVEDPAVMDAALSATARETDFAVVGLSGLDAVSHVHGMSSAAARSALAVADAQVGRLVTQLRESGRWERSVVVITGDHGFNDVRSPPGSSERFISVTRALSRAGIKGVRAVSDGGINHVYVEGIDPSRPLDAGSAARLREVRRLALSLPGIAEALYRLPLTGVGDASTVAGAHPDWRLDHPRMGEMLLVGERGVSFVDPPARREPALRGNHGIAAEEAVPVVLCGGSPRLRRGGQRPRSRPSLVDVGSTVAALLDLRPPRRIDGRPIQRADRGRVLSEAVLP